MFYGIEQSTDRRDLRTVIKKFSTQAALVKWMRAKTGEFTYDDPAAARNYHHTFRYGYEMNGRVDKKHRAFTVQHSPTYPRNEADRLADYICCTGTEITA